LLVADSGGDGRARQLYSASWLAARGLCVLGPAVLSWPDAFDSRAVFDANLRLIAFSVGGRDIAAPSLIVQQLDWTIGADGAVAQVRRLPVAVVSEPSLADAVRNAVGTARALPVPTQAVAGGVAIDVGSERWRVVWQEAQPVSLARDSAAIEWLRPPAPDSSCRVLAAGAPPLRGFEATMLEGREHCLLVHRGPAESDAAGEPGAPARDELRVALYRRPAASERARIAESPPPPLATVLPYSRPVAGSVPVPGRWALAYGGSHDGWLLLERDPAAPLVGLPLANCALWRQAGELRGSVAESPAPEVCPAR
jgi:hypothetical protein